MSDRPTIPLTVIGGYLGAGKTTLVNELLADPRGRRFGVVVNDVGEMNIDASLVAAEEGDMVTLGNGCVCCSAVDGFQIALSELSDPARGIDHIVVEVSGVGDPWKVAQWGRTPGFELDAVIVLADAEQVRSQAVDPYVGDTVLAQLRGADVVLVSKTDLLPAGPEDVTAWIASVCDAPILCPERGARSILELLEAARSRAGIGSAGPHAAHRSWSVVPRAVFTREHWMAWLQEAPAGVVRVKGLVSTGDDVLVVQRVGRRCEVSRWRGGAVELGLVAVATGGVDIDAAARWIEGVAAV